MGQLNTILGIKKYPHRIYFILCVCITGFNCYYYNRFNLFEQIK